jgi:hypothetical protein
MMSMNGFAALVMLYGRDAQGLLDLDPRERLKQLASLVGQDRIASASYQL